LSNDSTTGWCRIEYNGKEAYVETEYIAFEESPTIGVATNASKRVMICKYPDKQSNSAGFVPVGSIVHILDEHINGDWMIIRYNGVVGYVLADYIEK
jgi:uncharacterized protein YraI